MPRDPPAFSRQHTLDQASPPPRCMGWRTSQAESQRQMQACQNTASQRRVHSEVVNRFGRQPDCGGGRQFHVTAPHHAARVCQCQQHEQQQRKASRNRDGGKAGERPRGNTDKRQRDSQTVRDHARGNVRPGRAQQQAHDYRRHEFARPPRHVVAFRESLHCKYVQGRTERSQAFALPSCLPDFRSPLRAVLSRWQAMRCGSRS